MPRPSKIPGKPKIPGKSRRTKARSWFRPLRWLRLFAIGFLLSTTAAVLLFRFVPPPFTPLMVIRYTLALTGDGPARLHKSWRPLERISPRLVEAVIASEDQLFPEHWGFDWDAILSAFSINSEGKRKLGASTITQQTAKNLFLWPDRSWSRKALEAYFTMMLEGLWNKRRILEVYLNIIETGDGVYGAEAAAQKYFGVSAAELSRSQAALIAASLPNPRVWSPAKPSAYLIRRQNWILNQMDHLAPLPDNFSPLGQIPRSIPAPKSVNRAIDSVQKSLPSSTPPSAPAGESLPVYREPPDLPMPPQPASPRTSPADTLPYPLTDSLPPNQGL